jgi:excisionase family DNA binding protein
MTDIQQLDPSRLVVGAEFRAPTVVQVMPTSIRDISQRDVDGIGFRIVFENHPLIPGVPGGLEILPLIVSPQILGVLAREKYRDSQQSQASAPSSLRIDESQRSVRACVVSTGRTEYSNVRCGCRGMSPVAMAWGGRSMAPEEMSGRSVTVRADDITAARRLAAALEHLGRLGDHQGATMVTADGRSVEVAPFLLDALHELVVLLAQGDDVALVPVHHDVSLPEAATLLNVSRPFLLQLLDTGELPARGIGDDRRIPLREVVEYKTRRHALNRDDLATALRVVQEAGAYD